MRVLITGHTGFKGSWLTLMLNQSGHEVSGIALDPLPGGIFDRARVGQLLDQEFRADVRDANLMMNLVQTISPEVVFHLAAQPLVRESYDKPRETLETNVWGTLNIVDACIAVESVQRLIVITTDKVYRNEERLEGYREDDPLGGADPYSASKACADLLTQTWSHSYGREGLAITTARSGNVIGGGDVSPDRLIPDLLRAAESGTPALIRYPSAVRPWQHVLDAISGYVALDTYMKSHQDFSSWNFASDESNLATVREVCTMVADDLGKPEIWQLDESANPHEASLLLLNANKAKSELGWRNLLDVSNAISWTLNWEKTSRTDDPREVCHRQLLDYELLGNNKKISLKN